jgi:hypothetical protein
MGRSDEVPAFVDELVFRLCVVVGNPEVVVLRVDVREIEHLLEVTSDGADETKLDALSCHEGYSPAGKGRPTGSGQLAAGSRQRTQSAKRSAQRARKGE